ncbi:MAG: hypothetical protein ACLFUC_03105 [Bacteroidales bacterium]
MRVLLSSIFFFLFICESLLSQTERFVMPSDKKQLTVVTEPPTLYKGFLKTGLSYSHGFLYDYFNDDGKKEKSLGSLSAQSWFFLLSAQYGISDRLEVNVNIPYLRSTTNMSLDMEFPLFDSTATRIWSNKTSGISDIYFGFRYQLIAGDIVKPYLTLAMTATMPTAEKNPTNIIDENNYDGAPGTGEPKLAVDLNFKKIFYPFAFVSTLSYTRYFGGEKFLEPFQEPSAFNSGNLWLGYGGLSFHLNDWIVFTNEFIYSHKGELEIEGEGDGIKYMNFTYHPYLYFQINHLRVVQSVEIPLWGRYTSADPGYIFMVQYIF